jgi:DMSO/TMAO reductase YedYZ heme-binding membrane subunit
MKTKIAHDPKTVKKKPNKPLFPNGDWITIIAGVIMLSQTKGMGHHLGHVGIFLVMLALIARPVGFLWKQPLQYRRTIGILAFAAALAHTIYATAHVLNSNLTTILDMTSRHQWGIWAGIISLAAMTPAAVTSFPLLQKKLGKKWRQIHLLTIPALGLATFHTVLIGPHYMAKLQIETLDYLRIYGITIMTLLVLLMRKQIFWSIVGLKKKKMSM